MKITVCYVTLKETIEEEHTEVIKAYKEGDTYVINRTDGSTVYNWSQVIFVDSQASNSDTEGQ